MSGHPIIFSGPMILALLAGRKTMTRRLAWRDAGFGLHDYSSEQLEEIDAKGWNAAPDQVDGLWRVYKPTPWQRVKAGDRLWVRENIRCGGNGIWRYAADDTTISTTDGVLGAAMVAWAHHEKREQVPSIHMPRFLSRLTLIATATKLERLQGITKVDVVAEGIAERDGCPLAEVVAGWHDPFAALWDQLHGPGAWIDNPEVVAISYRVVRANIDAPEAVPA